MDFLSQLPGASLTPFTAYKLLHPKVTWANADPDVCIDPAEHAFCRVLDDDDAHVVSSEAKTFFADRYGGRGSGANGGSARCGANERVQIKGIGRTPLAGAHADVEHSYGGATLQEAVREALWGEICHIALPFGAVRVHGIVEMGTCVPYFSAHEIVGKSVRALIVRQPVMRPAHFLRAPFFVPAVPLATTDVARTRAAVAGLPAALEHAFSGSTGRLCLAEGLLEMSRRFAAQQAAAQAKRLVHGGLGPSNIALDGRWLDFGTIGMSTDYGRAAASAQADAWAQPLSLIEPIWELAFHAKKYLPDQAGEIPAEAELIQEYLRTQATRLRIEFGKLTGIPESALVELPRALLERFCACVQRVIARGNRYVFDAYTHGRPMMSGRFHLNTLLREASFEASPAACDAALARHLSDATLRREFVESYWALRSGYVQSGGAAAKSLEAHMVRDAVRVNTIVTDLCRPTLDDHIERVVTNGESIPDFIDSMVAKARHFLANPGSDGPLSAPVATLVNDHAVDARTVAAMAGDEKHKARELRAEGARP